MAKIGKAIGMPPDGRDVRCQMRIIERHQSSMRTSDLQSTKKEEISLRLPDR